MGIIYLVSTLVILTLFILIKKTDKPINIVSFICISIVLLFCYNAFLCYILTFFTIPITLMLLTIINLLISLILGFIIFIKKQIQNYVFNRLDTLYTFLILIIVLIISYLNFGFPFNVKYETSDPAVHYLAATMFAKSDYLLAAENQVDNIYGSLSAMKPMSYVNSGLIMKSVCKDLQPNECYNVFVWFGIFILFLTGATMYSTTINYTNKKEHKFYGFVISLICMLGYPLNSLLFGFEYMSMGLLIICAILCLINYYENNLLKLKWFLFIMALLNFGLFLAYYMFVPFVYSALWIYFCIKNYNKTKKIITKELTIILVISLLIPFALGFIYTIAPNIYSIFIEESKHLEDVMGNSSFLLNSGFKMNGYIYINCYSNMLLLIPLIIYLFVQSIGKKIKNNIFLFLILLFALLFIRILFIGKEQGLVSIYYIMKNYFALWIILLYCNYKALILLSEKGNYLPNLFIITYVILMIVCTIFSDVKLIDDSIKNKDENIFSIMEIFEANKTMLIKEDSKLNQDEIEILMYAKNNLISTDVKIDVVSEGIPYYWSYVLTEYTHIEDSRTEMLGGQMKLNAEVYFLEDKINKVDYMIYFKRSKKYKELKHKLFENSEIIYENSAGGILKYKN